MQVLNENYWIELLNNVKSIAGSLETIAAKPPITIQIRSPVGVEIATEEEGQ